MDRRQLKTRQAVFEAFTALLETKSYGSISVQEIIDRANIGRSTFYAHFETKDELLRALCGEIFDHVFSPELGREPTHDFSGRRDLKGEITHILYHLGESRSYIRGILRRESGELFMRYFRERLEGVFDGALGEDRPDLPREYLLRHLTWDLAETVRWWMDHESYTPEEVSRFFFAAAPLEPEA